MPYPLEPSRPADYSPPAGDLRTVANNLEYNEKMAAFRDYRRNHNELASWMEETVSLAWHHTCFDPAMDIGEWYRALKYKAKRPYEE